MVSQESQIDQQAAFNYAVDNVSEKKVLPFAPTSLKGSQFKHRFLSSPAPAQDVPKLRTHVL